MRAVHEGSRLRVQSMRVSASVVMLSMLVLMGRLVSRLGMVSVICCVLGIRVSGVVQEIG